MIEIFYLENVQWNIFDWVFENKTKVKYLFVQPETVEKENNKNYWLNFSCWEDPMKAETLTYYSLKRNNEKFRVAVRDVFGVPTQYDSLDLKEIKGTIFEIVDNWIKVR